MGFFDKFSFIVCDMIITCQYSSIFYIDLLYSRCQTNENFFVKDIDLFWCRFIDLFTPYTIENINMLFSSLNFERIDVEFTFSIQIIRWNPLDKGRRKKRLIKCSTFEHTEITNFITNKNWSLIKTWDNYNWFELFINVNRSKHENLYQIFFKNLIIWTNSSVFEKRI